MKGVETPPPGVARLRGFVNSRDVSCNARRVGHALSDVERSLCRMPVRWVGESRSCKGRACRERTDTTEWRSAARVTPAGPVRRVEEGPAYGR